MSGTNPRNRAKASWRGACLLAALALLSAGRGAEADAPQEAVAPWDFSGPVRSFEETCFEDFSVSGSGISPEAARRWLAEVPGHKLSIREHSKSRGGSAARVRGWARLKAPWPADAVMRLAIASSHPIKLHFWAGREGVSLVCYSVNNRPFWSAYRITRHPLEKLVIDGQEHEAIDSGLALVSTDDQRCARTINPTVHIRHQGGDLVVTHGDVRLLTAAMPSPPEEVLFELVQETMLRDLAMFRGGPVPEPPPCPRRIVIRGDRPDVLPWREGEENAGRLMRMGDGRVMLTADRTESSARTWFPVVRKGLYAIEVELDRAAPGTGVYLGDAEGRPIHGLEVLRDPRSGRPVLGHGMPEETASRPEHADWDRGLTPFLGRPVHLRLVCVGGVLKCWASGDGANWGRALAPQVRRGGYETFGLFARPGEGGRIGVRRLCVRELDGLSGLAPPQLLQSALQQGMDRTDELGGEPGAWQQRVWETCPSGVDPAAWQRASAVAALIGGEPDLSRTLLAELVRDALIIPMQPEARLRMLEDAALAADPTDGDFARELAVLYDRHVRLLGAEIDTADCSALRRRLARASIWTWDVQVEPLSHEAAREHALALATHDRWREVARFCWQAAFWNRPPEPWSEWPSGRDALRDTLGWLGSRAAALVPGAEPTPVPRERPHWSHPAVIQPDKDAYSTLAEIHSATENALFADAARMLARLRTGVQWSLVADAEDPRRFRTLESAVEELAEVNPALPQAIAAGLAEGERLRAQRVLSEGDWREVESLTFRYCGTAGAAEARLWLGDRLLAGGRFERALRYYAEAVAKAPDHQYRNAAAARRRLAAAMLGREAGEPVRTDVRFGATAWTVAQFESLVAELRAQHASPGAADPAAPGRAAVAVGPARVETAPWAVLDGQWGDKPSDAPGASRQLDWPARHTAVTFAGGRMLVANRFQVVALNLEDGKPAWRHAVQTPGYTHVWPRVPMRPVVWKDRVLVRLLPGTQRPALVSLALADGELQWEADCPIAVVSDPVVVGDRLFAFASDVQEEQPPSPLWLMELDPECGEEIGRREVLVLRQEWCQHRACEVTAAGARIVASLGGTVLCCDPFEGLRWVRRSEWTPVGCDPDAARQRHQAPIVVGDRLIVAQPGVGSVECLGLSGGRLCWQRFLPELEGIVQVADGQVVAATERQLVALACDSGDVQWRHAAPDRLDASAPAGGGTIVYLQKQPVERSEHCPGIVWCDAKTGREVARWPLLGLQGKHVLAGPIAARGDRTWMFSGGADSKGAPAPPRSILQWKPAGALPTTADRPWNAWVEPRMRTAAAAALPGWTLVTGELDSKTGFRTPGEGLPEVLVTKAQERPVRLLRRVAIPEGHRVALHLELGHAERGVSRIEVRTDGLPVAQFDLAAGTKQEPWLRRQIDLSPFAGRTVCLAVVQHSVSGSSVYMWWKRLEVIADEAAAAQ